VNPTRWRQITDLFHAALEREGEARAAFLRDATAGDPELLAEVQSLIASHERSGAFLDAPAWEAAAHLILDDERALTGKTLGAYRIAEEIGRGGMGVVYAAHDERLGRDVALKALPPEFTRDARRRERLTREARAAAALSHPSIATIYSLEDIDGELYIVSELVRGRTLREELHGGPLAREQLVPTLVQIASGLAAAHEQGIVHRDLKPENVIRRADGQVKILDFGLAHIDTAPDLPAFKRLTEAGVAMGTPGYMAPEQFGGRSIDARCDVFAFGVLAWELATGEHPFGADAAALLTRMTELLEGRSAGISRHLAPPALDRIVRRCLRARPAERYASGREMLEDVRALERASGWTSARAFDDTDRLWWWRFHQVSIASLNAAMPIATWFVRPLVRPFGSWLFFAALAAATVSVTLRLNLWFTSRVQADLLPEQRGRLYPSILLSDALLSAVLIALAVLMAGNHDEVAALLLTVAIVILASLALIEPTTTRAAGLLPPRQR